MKPRRENAIIGFEDGEPLTDAPMGFADKLKKLIGSENQTEVANQAKISAPAMSSYLAGDSKPSADAAVRLAKILNCDLEWLLDDDRSWGNRFTARSLPWIHEDQLVYELLQRYAKTALQLRESLLRLESIDWIAASRARKAAPGGLVPIEAAIAMNAWNDVFVLWSKLNNLALRTRHDSYPIRLKLPTGVTRDDLTVESIEKLDASIRGRTKGLEEFLATLNSWLTSTTQNRIIKRTAN